jgi:phage shock protein PspC (stress-responsive transcriptional regulator)
LYKAPLKTRTKGESMNKPFRRLTDREWIGGVCAGLAYWLGIPTWIVRMLWFAAAWFYGVGLGAYILLWIFVPEWDHTPEDYYDLN